MPLFPFPPSWILPSWRTTRAWRLKLRDRQIKAGYPEALLSDPEHDPWPQGQNSVHVSLSSASEFLHEKAVLGLSGDRQLWGIGIANPSGLHGYYLEVMGVEETPDDPANAPRFYLDDRANATTTKRRDHVIRGDNLGHSAPLALIACYKRVCYRAQAPWIERTWHAETGKIHEHMLHREQAPPARIAKVERGRQLLQRFVSTGRPPGTWSVANVAMSREDFMCKVTDIIKTLRQQGRKPTQELVAEKLGLMRDSQLRLYLSYKRFNVPWKQFLENR